MKRISAHYILSPERKFLKNGILVVDENGTILELIDTKGEPRELEKMEFHSGLLIPEIFYENISKEGLLLFHPYESLFDINNISNEGVFLFLKKMQQLLPDIRLADMIHVFSSESNELVTGNKPGIYLIKGADLKNIRLTEESKLKKLL